MTHHYNGLSIICMMAASYVINLWSICKDGLKPRNMRGFLPRARRRWKMIQRRDLSSITFEWVISSFIRIVLIWLHWLNLNWKDSALTSKWLVICVDNLMDIGLTIRLFSHLLQEFLLLMHTIIMATLQSMVGIFKQTACSLAVAENFSSLFGWRP